LALENWSLQELINAGWSENDLAWETLTERMFAAAVDGDTDLAKAEAGEALRLARESFEPIDPRLGTSFANFGICLSLAGDKDALASLVAKGLETWRSTMPWIARMQAPRVARSSMFHLRMEVLHRDTYRATWQKRWHEIAEDAIRRLAALSDGGVVTAPDGERIAAWGRERPAMLNDTRKLLAAGSLLLAPPVAKG
jgi:hypothetical protein